MCKPISKQAAKSVIITLLIILLLASVAGVIFAAIDLDSLIGPSFYNLEYKPLSIIQISFILYLLVNCLIGIIILYCDNECLNFTYLIFTNVGLFFFIAVGTVLICGGKYKWFELYSQCNSKDFAPIYKGIDTYLFHVDQNLCSNRCKCNFNSKTQKLYKNDDNLKEFYKNYIVTDDNINSANEFKHCPSKVIEKVNQETFTENLKAKELKLNSEYFYSFMKAMESKYECAGLCKTDYYNTYTKSQVQIAKYLFSDINNGPPKRLGCLNYFLNDVSHFAIVFGSIMIGISVVFIVIVILFTSSFNTIN